MDFEPTKSCFCAEKSFFRAESISSFEEPTRISVSIDKNSSVKVAKSLVVIASKSSFLLSKIRLALSRPAPFLAITPLVNEVSRSSKNISKFSFISAEKSADKYVSDLYVSKPFKNWSSNHFIGFSVADAKR